MKIRLIALVAASFLFSTSAFAGDGNGGTGGGSSTVITMMKCPGGASYQHRARQMTIGGGVVAKTELVKTFSVTCRFAADGSAVKGSVHYLHVESAGKYHRIPAEFTSRHAVLAFLSFLRRHGAALQHGDKSS